MATPAAPQLFINKGCPFAHRAYLAAAEKGLIAKGAVEIAEVSLPTPEWYNKEVNPRETVPALRLANGQVVPESLVVVQYLDDAFPEVPLLPKDPKDRADVRVFISDFDSATGGLYRIIFEKDDAARAELLKSGLDDIAYIERALVAKSAGPFFLGEHFSFADIAVLPFLDRFRPAILEFRGVDILANAPRLAALVAAAEKRASFQATAQTKEYYLAEFKKHLERN